MSTDTDTTLCRDCQVPIEAPKPIPSPFMFIQFIEAPLCKDCKMKADLACRLEDFRREHLKECPYKLPTWRPKP